MTRKKIKKVAISIVFWAILIISFCFFAFLIILKANGYQFDYRYWRIEKTGMIILDGQPKNVDIKLNQKYLSDFPERISNLSPGYYSINIFKDDYHSWQEDIHLEAGQAVAREKIVLFYQEPIENKNYQQIPAATILDEYQSANKKLIVKDREIFYQDKLISRFSQDIDSAALTSDGNHIVFQQNNGLHVMDINGTNNITLFNLSSSEPIIFTFRESGKVIIYLDAGQIYAKTITG
jgi:predicted XRE-type DNA-binding protein